MAKEAFYVWKLEDDVYRLRLDTSHAVEVEKILGKSLLTALNEASLTSIVTILWGAMQKFNHSVSMQDVYKLYDRYVDCGGSITGIIEVIMKVLEYAGFTKEEPEEQEENSTL